jgi:Single-strand binding protein family
MEQQIGCRQKTFVEQIKITSTPLTININQVSFSDRLGGMPEIKYTESGKVLCKFSIAVRRRDVKDTPLHPAVLNPRASYAPLLFGVPSYFFRASRLPSSSMLPPIPPLPQYLRIPAEIRGCQKTSPKSPARLRSNNISYSPPR